MVTRRFSPGFNWTVSGLLKLFLLIPIAILIGAFAATAGQQIARAETTTFQDDFDDAPAAPLYWVNEDPSKWRVEEGYLNIVASSLPTGGENLLLYDVGSADFMVRTHLLFEPNNNYQIAGLVIYHDGENFLQLGRAYCDHELCAGNAIYFDLVLDGIAVGTNFATPVDSLDEAYLRLEKRGSMVRGYYSDDGTTWFEIGTHWLPEEAVTFESAGLTASQDFWTVGATARFDNLEVATGEVFLPEGFHDGAGGIVPSWDCGVGGWAADPDNTSADLWIMVTVDGNPLNELLTAGEYRQDLLDAGACADGTCSFWTSLWELITPYETHSIDVYAADNETEDWVRLYNTPKDLTCKTFDIYHFKPGTLETEIISPFLDRHEFSPKWSPDGKMVVYDSWSTDWSDHGIYITVAKSGATLRLVDGINTGNPAWAPNGRWIAFNRIDEDGSTNLYLVSPQGGSPTLVVHDGFMAAWSPDSRRLVFNRPSDGTLMTAALDGSGETLVAPAGSGPDWSHKDNWIAYELNGDIWKVRVNVRGEPQEGPIQMTDKAYWEGRVSWAPNGKSLIYHAGPAGDTDIWSIAASGGVATWFTGAPYVQDYDPSFSPQGRNVAYSGLSPDGQAPREWVAAYAYDPPPGTFAEGTHPYHFEFLWSFPEIAGWTGQGGDLDVFADTPIYPGYALLRGFTEKRGVNTYSGLDCEDIDSVHPMQPTRFLVGWLPEFGPVSYAYAADHFNSVTASAVWDDGTALLTPHEVIPFYPDSWPAYVCPFTEAPMQLDLRINYGHDWVESFYEAGHEVTITVTENDGVTEKATATLWTSEREDWGGESGFQTNWDDWTPGQPDIQPDDWIYAEVDNGVTAQTRIGEITGQIDLEGNAISGIINASEIGDPFMVECLAWGSPEPIDNLHTWVNPQESNEYTCSWDNWDIDYWQDVGVAYFSPEGHWIANVFNVPYPHFTVFPEFEWFDGMEWPEGATVTITVDAKDECTTTAESWGGFFNGPFPEGCDLAAGDFVTFTDGDTVRTHTVRNLAITDVDQEYDTVSGTADPFEWLYVWQHEPGEQLEIQADEYGSWFADLAGHYDVRPGMGGRAEIRDDDGNATAVDWYLENPYIQAFAWLNQISLVDWPAGIPVTVSIENTDYTETITPDGTTNWYDFFPDVDLVGGTTINATNREISKQMTVSPLSAEVNPETGIVYGTATPFQHIHMLTGGDHFLTAIESDHQADEYGDWTADFSDLSPLVWFTRGEMWESDADGDVTYAIWHVRNELVEVWLSQNEIRAFDWPLGISLTFSVFDPLDETTYLFWADTERVNWMEGTIASINAGELSLQPGMTVTVSGNGIEESMVIQDIQITNADPDTEMVYGFAPEYSDLEILMWKDSPAIRFFSTQDSTDWTVDYSEPGVTGTTVDLELGDEIMLYLREENKNSTVWRYQITGP